MTSALQAWDRQQAAYIADRDGRFAALLDVVAHVAAERGEASPLVVDLACGPGSLAERVLERLPSARVIGIDWDPALLRLASEAVGTEHATWLELDLASAQWPERLLEVTGGEEPIAAVSSTALHWLTPPQLVAVYAASADVLASGGVLLNADHLRFGADRPTLRAVAEAHDAETQERSFAAGAQTWDAWWQDLRERPEFAPLVEERDRRFGARSDGIVPTTVEFHLAALRQAGFTETGTVSQLHDDYVVMARR